MLAQAATVELLRAYGFKCPESCLATTSDEAGAAAAKLGYPVILKAMVPNLAHRSDAGLVSHRVCGDAELLEEFGAIQGKARTLANGAVPISVDKFVAHDLEVILGVKYDASFGPVILCGLGGIFTEVLGDYALGLAPLTSLDAQGMLFSLKAYAILQKTASHLDSLRDALLRLSDLAVELKGGISAVDLNPIGLSAGSSEITVLDAKIHLQENSGG